MKKSIFSLLFGMIALGCQAASPNDTIAINQMEIKKWIEHETTNTKGAKVIKYYCIYNGQLVPTSKNVCEKAKLCEKFGAKCALICIGKKVKGAFVPKRIALN